VKQSVEALQDEDGILLEDARSVGSIGAQDGDSLAKGVRGGEYHFKVSVKHYKYIPVVSSCEIDKVFGINLDEPIISKVLGQDVQPMTDSVDKDFGFEWHRF
jgi:hypothetical protein